MRVTGELRYMRSDGQVILLSASAQSTCVLLALKTPTECFQSETMDFSCRCISSWKAACAAELHVHVMLDWIVFSTEPRGFPSSSSLSSHQHAFQMQPGEGARCEKMLMQALSNTVWAFSKLEVLDVELFGDIAREAAAKLPRFNAQNIANTVSRPHLRRYLRSYHCILGLFCMHGTVSLGIWRSSWRTLHRIHRTCTAQQARAALHLKGTLQTIRHKANIQSDVCMFCCF